LGIESLPQHRQRYYVRYDDCNLRGEATPAAILRFLQDIAGLHADKIQIMEGGVWVARRTVMDFHGKIAPRQQIEILTYPCGYTRVLGQRAYEVRIIDPASGEPHAEPILTARTLWVWLSPTGRPRPIPSEFIQRLHPDGALDIRHEREWSAFPTHEPQRKVAQVRFSDLDIVGHMNNAAYVQLLDDAAWEMLAQKHSVLPNETPQLPTLLHYDIEYLAGANFGDNIEVLTWHTAAEDAGNFERWQQVLRDGKVTVRSRSTWRANGVAIF
jgi:acyl-CoA thioesterase FadM